MEKGLWPILILVVVVVVAAWWSLSAGPVATPSPSVTPTYSPIATPTPTPEPLGIVINAPLVNAIINTTPIKVKGTVTGFGGWNGFEGQVGSVQLFDSNDKLVSDPHPLTATTDWMVMPASFSVSFGTKAMLAKVKTDTGYLLFKNENPSGDPAKDQILKLPVKFK